VARSIQIRPGIFVGPTVNLWKGVSFPENDWHIIGSPDL
jgi:hypothetical protein